MSECLHICACMCCLGSTKAMFSLFVCTVFVFDPLLFLCMLLHARVHTHTHTGKPVFSGSSTINQVERIMCHLPQPSKLDMESLDSPYTESFLRQVPKRSGSVVDCTKDSQL